AGACLVRVRDRLDRRCARRPGRCRAGRTSGLRRRGVPALARPDGRTRPHRRAGRRQGLRRRRGRRTDGGRAAAAQRIQGDTDAQPRGGRAHRTRRGGGPMTTLTTGTTTAKASVGTAHVRVEGRDKVTGAARYAGEIPFAELAHGWLVLSTVARGRIRSVETDPVLGLPGVLAVLHHQNAARVDSDHTGLLGVAPEPTSALFQHDRVPHMGWPVALVVAETSEQAREAAEALVVHYAQEPHDVAFTGGHPDAYPVDGHM